MPKENAGQHKAKAKIKQFTQIIEDLGLDILTIAQETQVHASQVLKLAKKKPIDQKKAEKVFIFLNKLSQEKLNKALDWLVNFELVPANRAQEKFYFDRCEELRNKADLSITDLADKAQVDRGLISSLESGNPHTKLKVEAIFLVLNQVLVDENLDLANEIKPQWFFNQCEAIRQKCKLKQAKLAKLADVSKETIENIEKFKGASEEDLTRVFNILYECYIKHQPQFANIDINYIKQQLIIRTDSDRQESTLLIARIDSEAHGGHNRGNSNPIS